MQFISSHFDLDGGLYTWEEDPRGVFLHIGPFAVQDIDFLHLDLKHSKDEPIVKTNLRKNICLVSLAIPMNSN